jgi:hypothetical protein
MAMPSAWSFDSMKRLSGLDTLELEGADPRGKTQGLGYYKFVEKENDRIIANAKRDFENYRDSTEKQIIEASRENGLPRIDNPPRISDPVKFGEDLSRYVTFLHPWMSEVMNQIVMMLMFLLLLILTIIVLRMRDLR